MTMLTARFVEDEGGATAIEYAMIAAFITIGAVTSQDTSLTGIFTNVNSDL